MKEQVMQRLVLALNALNSITIPTGALRVMFAYSNSPDSFKYYHFVDAENEDEFNAYVEKCRELSLYDTGVSAEYGDKLISLSTCEYSRTNGRLVVVAKLVK